jgi:hypothetical protein
MMGFTEEPSRVIDVPEPLEVPDDWSVPAEEPEGGASVNAARFKRL